MGGEVSIDTSPVAGDPEATVEKMRTIQAAAMAPANPYAADRAVAAKAAQMAMNARIEVDRMASEKSKAEGHLHSWQCLEFIARREQLEILDLFGKLDWDPDYDYKAERSRA